MQRILIDPLAVIIGDLNPCCVDQKVPAFFEIEAVIGWPLTTAITRTLSAQTVFGTPVQKTDNVSIIIVKMIVQVLFKKLIIDILLVIIVRIFRITILIYIALLNQNSSARISIPVPSTDMIFPVRGLR